jgi:hypothetical protein
MYTANKMGLTLDEFWGMNPVIFNQLYGLHLESQGKENPFSYGFIDD